MVKTKILAPDARFILKSYCDISVGNMRFYRIPEKDEYRMIFFDQNQNLVHSKEKNFKNIDECLLHLIDVLPEEPERSE